ncbi:MAG TPA: hypothetical protein VG795_12170 [Acidimicrobiia bacterium]|nr:hypothetical protein [Acidimicrobiia bacterium]
MRGLVVLVLFILMLTAVSVGVVIWWTTRMLRRLRGATRRLFERGTLSVRAYMAPPGRARQVAAARLHLRTGMEQTRRVLDDASRRNCPLGDLPGIFRRIEHLAGSVDAELRVLDGDRDPLQRAPLASVVQRSDELVAMAASIRRTVSGVHAEMQFDTFGLLQRDLDVELNALRAGAAAAQISRV